MYDCLSWWGTSTSVDYVVVAAVSSCCSLRSLLVHRIVVETERREVVGKITAGEMNSSVETSIVNVPLLGDMQSLEGSHFNSDRS
jgi:hypothetical protein